MEEKFLNHRIVRIQSRRNDTFRHFQTLLHARGIKKSGKTLVFGEKIVREIITTIPEKIEALVLSSRFSESSEANDPLLRSVRKWYILDSMLFHMLDIFNTGFPFCLCSVPFIHSWDPNKGLPGHGCSLLIPFQDPENVGASIRSAVAFGVKQVVILKEGAYPFHPKSIRASAGAVFRIKLFSGPSIVELPDSLPIIPLDVEGKDIDKCSFPESFGLLPGLEGPGIPSRWKNRAVSIPTTQNIESLNGSVALSIALYTWFRRSSLPEV